MVKMLHDRQHAKHAVMSQNNGEDNDFLNLIKYNNMILRRFPYPVYSVIKNDNVQVQTEINALVCYFANMICSKGLNNSPKKRLVITFIIHHPIQQ